jgi:hypothetical protein
MRRRDFITLAGGAAAAWPLTAFGKAQRIAIVLPSQPVSSIAETNDEPFWQAVFKELRRLGYVAGQTLVVEQYSAEGRAKHNSRLRITSQGDRNAGPTCRMTTRILVVDDEPDVEALILQRFRQKIKDGVISFLFVQSTSRTTLQNIIVADFAFGYRFEATRSP